MGERGREYFDRNLSVQAGVVGPVDFTHTTLTQGAGELVRAKCGARFRIFIDIFNHMVADSTDALDATFHALAHPTRRAMLAMLANGEEYTVGELAAPFNVSLAASSKHLIVLEKAKLVRRRVDGCTHACRLNAKPLKKVVDWTEEFRGCWERNFDKLDAVLHELKDTPNRRRKDPR